MKTTQPVIVVINKIDLLDKANMTSNYYPTKSSPMTKVRGKKAKALIDDIKTLVEGSDETPTMKQFDELRAQWLSLLPNAEVIGLSATENFGVQDFLDRILQHIPRGPKYYPSEYVSDRNERFFASEIIRESILDLYKVSEIFS